MGLPRYAPFVRGEYARNASSALRQRGSRAGRITHVGERDRSQPRCEWISIGNERWCVAYCGSRMGPCNRAQSRTRKPSPCLNAHQPNEARVITRSLHTPSAGTRPRVGFAPTGTRRLLTARARSRHSITRSARNSSPGGIVRPSCLAVTRLIASSKISGCSIGNSLGFAPLKILST